MWLIKEEYSVEEPLFWSNNDGWVDKDSADRFTEEQKENLNLPDGGKWALDCSHGSLELINEHIIEIDVGKSVYIELQGKCNTCGEIVYVERQLFKFERVGWSQYYND